MTDDSYISAAMRDIIGRPFGAARSYPVSESDIRRWALAVYYPEVPPKIFWDAEHAKASVHGGLVAPEEFNPFAWLTAEPGMSTRRVGFDPGHVERTFGVEPPPLRVNLNAGLTVRYGERMRPGDVITTSSAVQSYDEKTGRMGRMLITVVRTVWRNQDDALVKQTDNTAIRY
jgi:hypothetical protein